ncbi:MAG: DNA repair protein RadA [Clostridia bacterium]|nr:DNA repair protein RadA [Clostridia bacterium]
MAKKVATIFVCNECGYESSKWLGKCPSCNEWNSFVEEKQILGSSGMSKGSGTKSRDGKPSEVVQLKNVEKNEATRIKTGIGELDRVLGGGFVNGSLTLLGGEPGIGKSTLILQICNNIKVDGKILYVSGEESAEQIKIRADRLGISNENILFLAETDIDNIEVALENTQAKFVIIDSVQTMYSDEITSSPGSVSQVREITARIMKMCKQKGVTTIIIGHVTKDGNIAGPRVLEHMVDTVLYIEGERYFSYRILRGVKNRFGSTNEIGMFEMQEKGLIEVTNPSELLLSSSDENPSGTAIVVSAEGTRALLVEIQALTSTTQFGLPRRNANGIDYNRLTLLVAVLEKRGNLTLGQQDVYINLVGGIKINEPALDLGIVIATASAFKNVSVPKDVAMFGEVGLTGEIRNVNMVEKRLKEVEKLGFKKCIIPESNRKLLKEKFKLDIIGVRNINEAMKCLNIK